MKPITFWLKRIQQGKRTYTPKTLFHCEVFPDRILVSEDSSDTRYELDMEEILEINLPTDRHPEHAQKNYVSLTRKDHYDHLLFFLADPIFPYKVGFTVKKREEKNLIHVIQDYSKGPRTEIDPNPYIRCGVEYFSGVSSNAHPFDFYEQYTKEHHKLAVVANQAFIYFMNALGIIFLLLFSVWIIPTFIIEIKDQYLSAEYITPEIICNSVKLLFLIGILIRGLPEAIRDLIKFFREHIKGKEPPE